MRPILRLLPISILILCVFDANAQPPKITFNNKIVFKEGLSQRHGMVVVQAINDSKTPKPLTTKEIQLCKGATLFMTSGRYTDQNNPEREKLRSVTSRATPNNETTTLR